MALEGSTVERFPFRMSTISYIKSFAVDKLLAAAAAVPGTKFTAYVCESASTVAAAVWGGACIA